MQFSGFVQGVSLLYQDWGDLRSCRPVLFVGMIISPGCGQIVAGCKTFCNKKQNKL